MPLLSDAQHAQIRVGVVERLAFDTPYELQERRDVGRDSRGNPLSGDPAWVTFEAGEGGFKDSGLSPEERLIADQQGWSVAYVWHLPADSKAQPEHRILMPEGEGRVFHIGGVRRRNRNRKRCIAVCEERSH